MAQPPGCPDTSYYPVRWKHRRETRRKQRRQTSYISDPVEWAWNTRLRRSRHTRLRYDNTILTLIFREI